MSGREKDDGAIRFDLPTEWTASSRKPESSQNPRIRHSLSRHPTCQTASVRDRRAVIQCHTSPMSYNEMADPECHAFQSECQPSLSPNWMQKPGKMAALHRT
jgi:hypothetical protein